MKFYYLSIESNAAGFFEIHLKSCANLPDQDKRTYLGPFNNGKEALNRTIHSNPNAILCEFCCGKDSTIAKTSDSQEIKM